MGPSLADMIWGVFVEPPFTVTIVNPEEDAPMPENVPPKETAKVDALNPAEQAPGVPRQPMAGPASAAPAPAPGGARAAAPAAGAPAATDDNPGPGFVRIRWKNKIGGDEADEEWAEERRARNLESTGHAEIVKDDGKK